MRDNKWDVNTVLKTRWGISMKLTSAELTILGTLDSMERANAYAIWQKSGLKHYPTVLRALKKLQLKGQIDVMEVGKSRGNRLFALSLKGNIVLASEEGVERVMQILSAKSLRLKSLTESSSVDCKEIVSYISYELIKDILIEKPKKINIDAMVEDEVYGFFQSVLVEMTNYRMPSYEKNLQKSIEDIKRWAKIGWLREFILDISKDLLKSAEWQRDLFSQLISDVSVSK